MPNEEKKDRDLSVLEAISAYAAMFPFKLERPYLIALEHAFELFDGQYLEKLLYFRNGPLKKYKGVPTVPELVSELEAIEAQSQAEEKASVAADFDSIRATELAAHIRAQEARLPEIRKKFPSAYVAQDGRFLMIAGLDREPTESEIAVAQRRERYDTGLGRR